MIKFQLIYFVFMDINLNVYLIQTLNLEYTLKFTY
nr:MAG TPA: hypothetical protein [Caudoviricetes sp.]